MISKSDFIDLLIFEPHLVADFLFLCLSGKSTAGRSDIQHRIFPIHTRDKENGNRDNQYLGNHTHPCHQTFEHLIDREMSASVVVSFVSVAFSYSG